MKVMQMEPEYIILLQIDKVLNSYLDNLQIKTWKPENFNSYRNLVYICSKYILYRKNKTYFHPWFNSELTLR